MLKKNMEHFKEIVQKNIKNYFFLFWVQKFNFGADSRQFYADMRLNICNF